MKKLIFLITLIIITTGIQEANAQRRRHRHRAKHKRRRGVRQTERRQARRVVRRPRRIRRTTLVYRVRPRRRVIRAFPANYILLTHRRRNFYFHRGRYYRNVAGGYMVVAAPRGLRVRVLPVGYRRVIVNSGTYYYCQGTYYTQVNQVAQSGANIDNNNVAYEVTAPPTGAVVRDLPEETAQVKLNEEDLYEYDNTLYKKVITDEVEGYVVYGTVEDERKDEN